MPVIKFKIADVIIRAKSRFEIKPENSSSWRFSHFLYKGKRKSDIDLTVDIVKKIPKIKKSRKIFDVGEKQWKMGKTDGSFFLFGFSQAGPKKELCILNNNFNKGKAYFLSSKKNWSVSDILYGFLQVLLINFLSKRGGIIIHSVGICDKNKGLLFIGPTESGKSTLARIWHKNSRSIILNDDRIAIRKIGHKFILFGTPWHGDFRDYLKSSNKPARLSKIFFIQKGKENKIKKLTPYQAFLKFFPNAFVCLWDREKLAKNSLLIEEIVRSVSCFSLEFKKDKTIIDFVRKI